ncbi:hypothetical protein PH562_16615 [Rhizobium sp. CNPSo 4062]|uniref:hypothetical protein n=1 Tax=Rhizobium sp. CNPSo 4062 TaxID=3021410 RepID=UPI00254EE84B|nr:hypothetical protein [Rhizobium sp. CNPSo 4062]MDK4703876.1 hypothetical protein [Rhizobium sp. CNPSo 4062]
MTSACANRLVAAVEDIRARRCRSITVTEDGTVIIVCAETGKSASGRTVREAKENFERAA